jgi:uncharacterized heparinase superfamily protein
MTKSKEKLVQSNVTQIAGLSRQGPYFIFRSFSKNKEVYMHFNAASSGALPKAAHGHADALSIVLHIGGNPFIVDPGNKSYQVEYEWRKYFRGTLSHNTLKINLKDQTEVARPFFWQDHYSTKILKTKLENNILWVKALHDGYKNMGIIHSREIIFDKSKNLIRINDTIECNESGFFFVELPFHFHPSTIIKQNNLLNFQAVDENEQLLYLVADKKLKTKIIKGQMIPQILGWYSDTIDRKEPSTTIYCTALINRTETFQTLILIR